MKKRLALLLFPLAIIGLLDAGYLAFEHYQGVVPLCSTNPLFGDCGKVLKSEYSTIFGVPLALVGFIHYSILSILIALSLLTKKQTSRILVILLTGVGFLSSMYFIYLQLFVIGAICAFCMLSATTSTLLFFITQIAFSRERKVVFIAVIGFLYRNILKRIFFRFDPEFVHNHMTRNGQLLGNNSIAKSTISYALEYNSPLLEQTIEKITFKSPVGLSAGFDYEARLPYILPSLGFGFGTIGTITNKAYEGNPRPLLGRLPDSKSLMVNKGFKNLGAKKTIEKLGIEPFAIPIGISIGRTNSRDTVTLRQSIEDIIKTFQAFEKSSVKHAYYELNISCPNLFGNVSFYPPSNLKSLLAEVDSLHITRPIFIKMPIEGSDKEILRMLHIISLHTPQGVIFGNLQKNRKHPTLAQKEVKQFKTGNFSGKPTFDRSNELIKLSYKHYKQRFTIIGTGGIFTAADAYTKITLGASLVQLITGMIFNGPQLISQINIGLEELLKKDGFENLADAIGSKNIYRRL